MDSAKRRTSAKLQDVLRTMRRTRKKVAKMTKKRRTNPEDMMVAVDRSLWIQFRALAALQDIYGRELLAQIIQKEITAWESKHGVRIAALIDPDRDGQDSSAESREGGEPKKRKRA